MLSFLPQVAIETHESLIILIMVYIKSCCHEVAKVKSGGNMPIPSDCTTFSHNIKEDGNAIRTMTLHGKKGSLQ
jgi:hypothetical protein